MEHDPILFQNTLSLVSQAELPNGETLTYISQGDQSVQKDNVILFLHGQPSSLWVYEGWWQLLENKFKGFRLIFVDWRGCGDSTYNKPCNSNYDYAEDFALFCQVLKLENVHVVGASAGGGVAMAMAIKYTNLVQSISLISSIPVSGINFMYQDELIKDKMNKVASKEDLLKNDLIKMFYKQNSEQNPQQAFDENLIDLKSRTIGGNPSQQLIDRNQLFARDTLKQKSVLDPLWFAVAFNASPSGDDLAKNIICPVYVYHGKKDFIDVKDTLFYLWDKIQGVVIQENGDHGAFFDETIKLVDILHSFIGQK